MLVYMLGPAEQRDEVGGSFYLALKSESFEAVGFSLQHSCINSESFIFIISLFLFFFTTHSMLKFKQSFPLFI